MTATYRFLEDIALADAAFEATGDSPSELFQAASHALMDTLANPATISPRWERTIMRRDPDLSALLFDWLSDLVYLKDAEGVVFHDARVTLTHDAGGGEWRLSGTLSGAPVDPACQELRADVKGVTKHLYELTREGNRWKARVVLDI